ncbi:hypothetical protein EK21DRAFT_114734 [Setomelanomma holmii]|uniref:Uncharacterized protein n=1 Tax=Setomelanomma holmii TaxID=210430 RepID=A0A9P4LJE2_9PLEO|nr:hypothetical protein EK21DRAFT_114734 [Setomelanomma holmii]
MTAPPLTTGHAYVLLRSDWEREREDPWSPVFSMSEPAAIVVTTSYQSALRALNTYKEHVLQDTIGDLSSGKLVFGRCRNTVHGVDIILVSKDHALPVEIRLRIQGVDFTSTGNPIGLQGLFGDMLPPIKQDLTGSDWSGPCIRFGGVDFRKAYAGGHDWEKSSEVALRTPLPEGHDADTANTTVELRSMADFDPLPLDIHGKLPRGFAGHSIDGGVHTLKWERGTQT